MGGGKAHGQHQVTLESCVCLAKRYCLQIRLIVKGQGKPFRCPLEAITV